MIRGFGALIALISLCVLVLLPIAPPAPPAGPVAPGEFDAGRAFEDLHRLASAPRAPGTPAHDDAREYLLAALGTAGWDARVQEVTWARPEYAAFDQGYPVRAVRVQNVVARRAGTTRGETAVLLVAHYDSKTTTPGASDDGYGTAALLETARALAAGPPLARDVILLFSDGEELGLFGAAAFAGAHPWQKDVGVVLNFEARGNAGPALMFETSGPDLTLVRALAAAPHPMGNSLARAIYERMPNDTDFSEWRRRGVPGLNFANIGGFSRYHAPADTVANASRATLAHHGRLAVAIARQLAQTPPNVPLVPDRGRAVYFDVAGLAFVVYPSAWSPWVTLLAAGLLVAWIVLLTRRDPAAPRRVGLAFGSQLGALTACVLAAVGLLVLTRALRPDAITAAVRPAATLVYLLAFAGLGFVAAAAAARTFPTRVGVADRTAAGGVLWLVVTLVLHRGLPGGAYLLAWPLVGLALGGLAATRLTKPVYKLTALIAGALPALLLLPEHAYHVAQAFGVLGGPAVTIAAALFLLPQAGLLALMTPRRWPMLLPALAAVGALVLFAVASALPLHDETHPRPGTLFVAHDADRGEATWASPDGAPAPWVAARVDSAPVTLPAFFPLEPERPFLVSSADAALAAAAAPLAPGATLVEKTGLPEGARRLRLRLTTPAGTVALGIYVAADAGVRAASLDGAAIERLPTDGGMYVHYWGPPDAGSELVLDVVAPEALPVTVRLVAQHAGFPPGVSVQRPAGDAAKPSMVLPPHQEFMDSDTTLSVRTVTF